MLHFSCQISGDYDSYLVTVAAFDKWWRKLWIECDSMLVI